MTAPRASIVTLAGSLSPRPSRLDQGGSVVLMDGSDPMCSANAEARRASCWHRALSVGRGSVARLRMGEQ
jgi:hypothetical protein